MSVTQSFNVRHWIIANCASACRLGPETIGVVSNFTLMWNLFEGILCKKHATIRKFERLAERMAQHQPIPEGLDEAVKFWTARYWMGSEFTDQFNNLHFRPTDREDHVRAVLSGKKKNTASLLFAMMVIVYRLRNNLFHGLKTIDMLNDQTANLDMACRFLASILEASGAPFLQNKHRVKSSRLLL